MAYDDRDSARRRELGRDTRTGRPERLGDRNRRDESDDPDYGLERYGGGAPEGYGAGESRGPGVFPDSVFGAPGYDASFAGPRFDRLDVGSTGTHGVHPVSSPYGGAYRGAVGIAPGGGYASSARRYAELGRGDPQYSAWRERQIDQFDRDYDDYRRDQQDRFDREFGAWRERRGEQRRAVGRVSEHMEVVGADGRHVGTVDCTKGDTIVLTRSDSASHGHHHTIPCGWVDRVDDKVRLNLGADEAMARWRHEDQGRALFERERGGRDHGPHALNRSFAGTYRDKDDDR
jgi:hypothetical protein